MENLLLHSKLCEGMTRPDDFHHKFVCIYCQYHTYYNDNMRKHIRKHTGEKPFKCLYCQRRFSRKDSVQTHMKLKHTEIDSLVVLHGPFHDKKIAFKI